MPDILLANARIATMRAARYAIVERGALRMSAGRVAWIGPQEELPPARGLDRIDLGGALVTPGLVDCHTHLVYAGTRASEFAARLEGRSYEDIAREGGGILSTVRATRAATDAKLRAQSLVRLRALAAEGVTTVEIKSGYGLDLASELKCLRVARSLAAERMRVVTTLLAAHSVPPEFAGRADAYVDWICDELLPAVARDGLADAVDAFCESIAFSVEQTRRVFERSRVLSLRVKLHADQLSNSGGAALAAEFQALSADHLEHTDEAGIAAMARAGTVAVLLPGAFYSLRETKLPPIAALRASGVPMAIASDCNPGTSPIASPVAILNMACVLFRLTPEEALAGMTCHGARALGLDDAGTLEVGARADVVVWPVEDPAELCAQIGIVKPLRVYFGGEQRK
jgi:imidazolonepropionase